jgi:predicted alpha/beta superfamily hydrolase
MRKLTVALFCLCFAVYTSLGQMTIVVNPLPQLTPLRDSVFIVGSFNNWIPGESNYALSSNADGTWQVEIPGTNGEEINFKFTRGNSWSTVEGSATGGFIPDRSVVFQNNEEVNLTIEGWEDQPGNHTVTEHVRIFDMDFPAPSLNTTRRIWVCLPVDYTPTVSYPVLYMHDAQNLFDASTSFAGEWQVDEHLSALQSALCQSIIVVGIDHGGSNRINELAPWFNSAYNAGGQGEQYAQFIINDLKPAIDEAFPTLSDRANTFTAGSSLGALISAYLMLEHSNTFSKAGLFSPAFWFNRTPLFALANNHSPEFENGFYFVGGTNESSSMISDMEAFKDILIAEGYNEAHLPLYSIPDGEHNEAFWSSEYSGFYEWLAMCTTAEVEASDYTTFNAFPNPTHDTLHIQWSGSLKFESLVVFDGSGKKLINQRLAPTSVNSYYASEEEISTVNWPSGVYTLQLKTLDGGVYTHTFVKQ